MNLKQITLLLAWALLCSLGLNGWLYQRSEQYYRELNETRLNPIGLEAFADQPILNQAHGRIAVFYGDSRAAEWVAPDLPGVKFVNRGIGAQTTAQVLARFDAQIVPLRPDVVVIQVGINDLKAIELFPQRRDAIIADCKENIAEMVRRSRMLRSRVILTTIFPHGSVPFERIPFWSEDVDLAIREVNQYLHILAGDQVVVLESATILSDSQGLLRPDYARDFLHPNDTAYTELNKELMSMIR